MGSVDLHIYSKSFRIARLIDLIVILLRERTLEKVAYGNAYTASLKLEIHRCDPNILETEWKTKRFAMLEYDTIIIQ